jgi:hypothetical protein
MGVDEGNKIDSWWELMKEIKDDHVQYMIMLVARGYLGYP